MAPNRSGGDQSSRWGYVAAIVVSALLHAFFLVLALVVLPAYMSAPKRPAPAYTVKIVDSLPAGNLGTHLPRLSAPPRPKHENHHAEARPEEPPKLRPPENDKNAIALNSIKSTPKPKATPTPTPTPTPPPTPVETATPVPHPHPVHHLRPTPKPTPRHEVVKREEHKHRAKPTPTPIKLAKVEPTPNVNEEMAKLHKRLLAEHLKEERKSAAEAAAKAKAAKAATEGEGGPVTAGTEIPGKGYGIGPGSGSAGIQQDVQFLLYYHVVQEKIKKAWSFSGNNPDLTATVTFQIGADGSLTGVKVSDSSRDPAFDDSVVRAIRRAAPFPAPPDKYRGQFAQGIEAVFKLGELSSPS